MGRRRSFTKIYPAADIRKSGPAIMYRIASIELYGYNSCENEKVKSKKSKENVMGRRRYWITAVAAVCLAGMWGVRAFGQLTEKQGSLAGIDRVSVFVEGLTEHTKKAGLRSERIQTELVKRLKELGITVVSKDEAASLAGSPVVYVNISAFKIERAPEYVYRVEVGLLQQVTLVRDRQIRIMSITWNKGQLGYCQSRTFVKSVRETVGYLMDGFSEDYKATNPVL